MAFAKMQKNHYNYAKFHENDAFFAPDPKAYWIPTCIQYVTDAPFSSKNGI